MVGMNAQCVQFSPAHDAVIVTMGNGGSCGSAWANTRAAIVSSDHPLYNATRHLAPPSFRERVRAPFPLHLHLDLLVLVLVLVFLHVLVILLLLPCPGSAPFTDGGAPSPQATAARAEERQLRADILALAPFMREHAHRFSAEDLAIYSERLVGYGEPPIVHAEKK